jgi:hypothetical protein
MKPADISGIKQKKYQKGKIYELEMNCNNKNIRPVQSTK